jgi:hypothetical protein
MIASQVFRKTRSISLAAAFAIAGVGLPLLMLTAFQGCDRGNQSGGGRDIPPRAGAERQVGDGTGVHVDADGPRGESRVDVGRDGHGGGVNVDTDGNRGGTRVHVGADGVRVEEKGAAPDGVRK